ncbi:MAG: DUF1826 domain-containing protein [Myxococcales bacterium]|nr:DUF1826 domain-containing protein [Myxococcales bacterium]
MTEHGRELAAHGGQEAFMQNGHSGGDCSVRTVDHVAGLSALFDDSVNIVTFSRPLDAAIVGDAQLALGEPGLQVLTSVTPSDGPGVLMAQMKELPYLTREAHFWVEVLAELTGCGLVGFRLVRLDAAMCPRFHVDKLTVRVVCAFAGNGTEYVAEHDVDRRWLGHAASGLDDEASGLLRTGARIRRAGTGDVVLLKGEAWPGNAGRGAVHRSPSATSTAPRLVMTLDPL